MTEAKRPWWVPALGVAFLLSLVTAPAWLIIAGAIHADMQKRLPNGYRVAYLHGDTAVIIRGDGERVIGPSVTGWRVLGDLVRGDLDDGGMFAVDTRSGEIVVSRDPTVVAAFVDDRLPPRP